MRKLGPCLVLAALAATSIAAEPTTIRMMAATLGLPPPSATDPRSLARRAVFEEFHRQNPDIRVVNAGGLELPGDKAESNFLMSMAGDTAPDVFYVNFRQYYNYIDQGFCRPLDDLIARNPSLIERVNPTILEVIQSYDGKVYALPFFQVAQGLYYRKDHFKEAGLDPNRPPKTWDEYYEYAKRITESHPGRSGAIFSANPQGQAYHWINFLWQAGGEVVQPAADGKWRATIATEAGAKALDFYRKITTEKWVGADGKTYGPAASVVPSYSPDIAAGKASMWFSYSQDIILNISDIPPSLIGIAPMPAGPAGSWNEINAGMWAISSQVKDPKKLEAAWRFINYWISQEAARVSTEKFIDFGMANLVNPTLLKEFGYEELVSKVDPGYVQANENLFKTGKPEPYGRNCSQVYTVLDTAMDRSRLEPDTPSMQILQEVQEEMNQVLLGYTPAEIQQVRRTWALGILISLGLVCSFLVYRAVRKARENQEYVEDRLPKGAGRVRALTFIGLCLLPAVLSLLVWAYYPLGKGLQIAFQDYRIIQGATWVGLDNFIDVFTQPIFYQSLMNSFVYVFLLIGIGFFIPIFLALALNEIPRAKVLLRTVFYLPAMTSPIVIAFLWRQFYDKSEEGVLNSILNGPVWLWTKITQQPFTPLAIDWLGDPKYAMLAVVIPGIWAGAGPGSILYLAALKNIPDERYEAADLDGASWVAKIRFITLPGLKPLMLINLLGVFIAGFKAMENIFVLTGGGPLRSTRVIGLEVWENAFMFLKFGYATAAAWVMGAILIGFTVIQIKQLTKMKFTTAKN
ncbi:extracellular solute-binding protein [Kamptonema cortianum]|nr:extracellular solute-binding protein [Geitlerinema splendidum]MDK3160944.1 extracellular solute-binding protein [Kamptonema cortianum]